MTLFCVISFQFLFSFECLYQVSRINWGEQFPFGKKKYMLFEAQEVHIATNCAQGLEYIWPQVILKIEGRVFPSTHQSVPANNMFIFSLKYCFESNFCVEL